MQTVSQKNAPSDHELSTGTFLLLCIDCKLNSQQKVYVQLETK